MERGQAEVASTALRERRPGLTALMVGLWTSRMRSIPLPKAGLTQEIYQALKANGIQMICHVSDRVLAELIKLLEAGSHFAVIPVTREEEGGGVLCGGFLGGMKGALLIQQREPARIVGNRRVIAEDWQAASIPG